MANDHRLPEYVPDDSSSEDDDSVRNSWILSFCTRRGNEYFCVVDMDFILDRFNLTGLGHEIPHAQEAYEIISDSSEYADWEEGCSPEVLNSAKILYGLIHARFLLTPAGFAKMKKKYLAGEFGVCPRVYCSGQPLIPVGLSDVPHRSTVKLYCAHCEDVYNPKSAAHNAVDGAFFGTTFAHLFFQAFPQLKPAVKSEQRYIPRIFGFRIAGETTLKRLREGEDLDTKDPNNHQSEKDRLSSIPPSDSIMMVDK